MLASTPAGSVLGLGEAAGWLADGGGVLLVADSVAVGDAVLADEHPARTSAARLAVSRAIRRTALGGSCREFAVRRVGGCVMMRS
jgi:hypothetical protein